MARLSRSDRSASFPHPRPQYHIRGLALPAYTTDDIQLARLERFVTEGLADHHFPRLSPAPSTFDEIAEADRFGGRQPDPEKSW